MKTTTTSAIAIVIVFAVITGGKVWHESRRAAAMTPTMTPLQADIAFRTKFTDGFAKSCVPSQKSMPANKNVTEDQIKAFCGCTAKGVVDAIPPAELVKLFDEFKTIPNMPQSVQNEVAAAAQACQ
jgi:hypothetical protein